MTAIDKVRTYNKLYAFYKDINKVAQVVNVSKTTIQKYIKLNELSDDTLALLDAKDENKISISLVSELVKLPENINPVDVVKLIKNTSFENKIQIVKEFVQSKSIDIADIDVIKIKTVEDTHAIKYAPKARPFVYGENSEEILIPEENLGLDRLIDSLRKSKESGKTSSIVVVAEGDKIGKNVL